MGNDDLPGMFGLVGIASFGANALVIDPDLVLRFAEKLELVLPEHLQRLLSPDLLPGFVIRGNKAVSLSELFKILWWWWACLTFWVSLQSKIFVSSCRNPS